MIEVMVIESMNGEQSHQVELEQYLNAGYDLYSNHVTYNSEFQCMIYTSFLTRGSRPGQANKASQIEILENEIKALKAIAEANSLAIKAVDSRLDAAIKDFHGGEDEEAVPNNWLEDYMANLRALNTKPQIIPVDSIRIHGTDYSYEDVISEALREDEELGR